jgi:hypothetical protein
MECPYRHSRSTRCRDLDIAQARRTVDMLNLLYHDMQDEKVYQVPSRRLKDKFDIFGWLPDTIEDDWIENVERLETMVDEYVHLRQKAKDFVLSFVTRRPSILT